MKTAFKRSKIDSGKYVNINTGELLSSEQPNVTSVNQATDMVSVNSKEFVVIDSAALAFVQQNFNQAEQGRIMQMSDMVRGCYNILFNKNSDTWHTKDTLADELEYTRNIFATFLKKLFEKSIIYYIVGKKGGSEHIWIMLNPTLARKSKFFHKDCRNVFEDLSRKK